MLFRSEFQKMNIILCLLQKCGALLMFVAIWLLHQVVLLLVGIGKWFVTYGTELSNHMEHTVSRLNDILSKECPEFDFDWETFRALIMICFVGYSFGVVYLIILEILSPSPSGTMDISYILYATSILPLILILMYVVYALRHILPWIAGILIILGLVSALVSAPSCSAPSVTAATSEKATEHCRFYEKCYWSGISFSLPTWLNPANYCWPGQECYDRHEESSGSAAPVVTSTVQDSSDKCHWWNIICLVQQYFSDNDPVALKPKVVSPVKATVPPLPSETTDYIVQDGDTLWKLAGGDPAKVQQLYELNAPMLDSYWSQHCTEKQKQNKYTFFCRASQHTLMKGMTLRLY